MTTDAEQLQAWSFTTLSYVYITYFMADIAETSLTFYDVEWDSVHSLLFLVSTPLAVRSALLTNLFYVN